MDNKESTKSATTVTAIIEKYKPSASSPHGYSTAEERLIAATSDNQALREMVNKLKAEKEKASKDRKVLGTSIANWQYRFSKQKKAVDHSDAIAMDRGLTIFELCNESRTLREQANEYQRKLGYSEAYANSLEASLKRADNRKEAEHKEARRNEKVLSDSIADWQCRFSKQQKETEHSDAIAMDRGLTIFELCNESRILNEQADEYRRDVGYYETRANCLEASLKRAEAAHALEVDDLERQLDDLEDSIEGYCKDRENSDSDYQELVSELRGTAQHWENKYRSSGTNLLHSDAIIMDHERTINELKGKVEAQGWGELELKERVDSLECQLRLKIDAHGSDVAEITLMDGTRIGCRATPESELSDIDQAQYLNDTICNWKTKYLSQRLDETVYYWKVKYLAVSSELENTDEMQVRNDLATKEKIASLEGELTRTKAQLAISAVTSGDALSHLSTEDALKVLKQSEVDFIDQEDRLENLTRELALHKAQLEMTVNTNDYIVTHLNDTVQAWKKKYLDLDTLSVGYISEYLNDTICNWKAKYLAVSAELDKTDDTQVPDWDKENKELASKMVGWVKRCLNAESELIDLRAESNSNYGWLNDLISIRQRENNEALAVLKHNNLSLKDLLDAEQCESAKLRAESESMRDKGQAMKGIATKLSSKVSALSVEIVNLNDRLARRHD